MNIQNKTQILDQIEVLSKITETARYNLQVSGYIRVKTKQNPDGCSKIVFSNMEKIIDANIAIIMRSTDELHKILDVVIKE